MQKKLHFVGGLLLIGFCHSVVAQINFSFSDYFDQFYNNYYLVNTANADTSYKATMSVSNRNQIGLFQGINKIYMDADLRMSPRENSFHFVGLQAINNREGDFINKNRLMGRYSWRTMISHKSSLSAGLSLGFVNYAFNTSQAGVSGSSWAPDGNTGIWYLQRKWSLGVSMQQMFSRDIIPVNQTFFLGRYYNVTAKHVMEAGPFLKLHHHFYSKLQQDQPMFFSLASVCEWKDKLEAGINYRHQRGLSYMISLKDITIGSSRFSFYFSYFVGTSRFFVSDHAMELLIKYSK